MNEKKYLELLSLQFPTREKVLSEIVELTARSTLPKGTEYFLSDLHGQYDSFDRILRSASGNTRTKISLEFEGELTEDEMNQLANLIYEPLNFITILKDSDEFNMDWCKDHIYYLLRLLKRVGSKYSKQKVFNFVPPDWLNLIDELLAVPIHDPNKQTYFFTLIETIVDMDGAEDFIIMLCELIQNLNIDRLHIVGDIYDRGPRPDIIMDTLIEHEDVDIQWGNHDITWLGAYLGSEVCMANCIRNAMSYNNFDAVEYAYGINLRPLASFAEEVYHDDPCTRFKVKVLKKNKYEFIEEETAEKMHKAIAIIQFKLESQLFERNPELRMSHRNVLKFTDFRKMTFTDRFGKEHPLLDTNFPTIDPDHPNVLTEEETAVIHSIRSSFLYSDRLKEHMDYLLEKGSIYKIVNSNLLFHGCIPMNDDGSFQSITFNGKEYAGKALMDYFERAVRQAQYLKSDDPKKQKKQDFLWYLWCGQKSPLFGKSQISTYENYFIADKAARKEELNPYYKLSYSREYVNRIFEEFSMDPNKSHIINGHMPVKSKDGEKPIRADGRVYVIDGGISEVYQKKTGIAGYTLTFNSHHLALAEHRSFHVMESVHGAYSPTVYITEEFVERQLIRHTDRGKILIERIEDLKHLLDEYRKGTIKEKPHIVKQYYK